MNNNIDDTLNEEKLEKIKFKILQLESQNAKTKNYDNKTMVDKIKHTIINVVDEKTE